MNISEIKSRLSMQEVLQHYGLKPNRNRMLNCPFHEDKKPSMQYYADSNTVYCFSGNCDLSGKSIDQIDFIVSKLVKTPIFRWERKKSVSISLVDFSRKNQLYHL